MIDVVITARNMGVFTIVCDYSSTSPAKSLADKSYDVSTTDIDALYEISLKENIDGVFAGFEDLNTWNALRLAQRLNLPFYATEEQLLLTSNKQNFKNFCRDCGVPVVPEYVISTKDEFLKFTDEDFPLIVKPVDSYGSRGITVVRNLDELESAYEKAKSFSKTQTFIIEKFYSGYGIEFYYTVVDGTPYMSAMTDRYVINQGEGVPPLPTATIFPSKHMEAVFDEYDSKIKAMIRKMGIKNGLLLFQSVFSEGKVYVYEMAFRLTGEKHYQIVKNETGIDLMEFMINLSLGRETQLKLELYNKNSLPKPACNLAVLVGKGKICRIEGLNQIVTFPEVIDYVQTLYVGDEVNSIGNYGQILVRFNIVADTSQRLIEILNDIEINLKVFSIDNEDMIISHFIRDEKDNKIFN